MDDKDDNYNGEKQDNDNNNDDTSYLHCVSHLSSEHYMPHTHLILHDFIIILITFHKKYKL
jgi:hypothetical protein